MQAAGKTRHTTRRSRIRSIFITAHAPSRKAARFHIFGRIPPRLIRLIRKEYSIEQNENEYVDFQESSWYQESKKRLAQGGLVRILRVNKTLSQSGLGDLLGVSGKYVSDIEKGRRPVSLKLAHKLGEIFDRKPERFVFSE